MDRKSICIVVYDYGEIGGVNAVAYKKAVALSEKYSVKLLSIVDKGDKKHYDIPSNVNYNYLLKNEQPLKRQMFNIMLPAYKFFKNNHFDLVICMGHYSGFLLSFLRIITKTKFVFSDHGALYNQWSDYKARIMRIVAAKTCHKIVVLTERNKADYIKKLCVPPSKISCIYNWIDIEECDQNAVYNQKSTSVIAVGRLGKEKGFDLLIKIFSRVIKKHPNWTLDIYGCGEMENDLQELILELKAENNIHLLGMRRDVIEQYKHYSFYVMTSYREGLPLVLLEAKANGLPIISFDIMTGPSEIINNGLDGILIPAYDLECFENAICDLIDNKEKRIQMASNARLNLLNFSKERVLRNWIELIEELSK